LLTLATYAIAAHCVFAITCNVHSIGIEIYQIKTTHIRPLPLPITHQTNDAKCTLNKNKMQRHFNFPRKKTIVAC
jgi:hypothetical protein